jgi:chorismate mutase
MRQRLLVMHDVARSKWNSGKPLTDAQREQALLEAVIVRGQERGLDPVFVRKFFTAQIEAGKLVQQADLDQWQAQDQPPFAEAHELSALRRRLDELNDQLIDALVEVWPTRDRASFSQVVAPRARVVLTGEGIDETIRARAIRPLEE